MMASKLSNERLHLNCSVNIIYSMLNQMNSSIEIHIIYAVYMTAEQFSWKKHDYKSRIHEIAYKWLQRNCYQIESCIDEV